MNKATQIELLKMVAEMSHEYDVIEEIVSIVEELEDDLQRDAERALQEVEPNRVTPRGEVETRINGEEVKVRL